MKRFAIAVSFALFLTTLCASAPKEGMWLPILLDALQVEDMQAMGLELTAEDLFSTSRSSLKDAIVSFGGFCTGSMISPQGLLLTNHHCGYSRVQQHSSVENDYLKNGYWAKTQQDELPNQGLFATFIVDIKEVTERVLEGVEPGMAETARQAIIRRNMASVEAVSVEGTHYRGQVRSFYAGNRFFLIISETYNDVRLVGAPPNSIGKFGGDTDNWVWPRHTGDFALFRIYAGPDNRPAAYSADNKPFIPKHYLPMAANGVSEGDFTMVYGFPGTTEQYRPSVAVAHILHDQYPIRIDLRTQRLEVIDRYMAANDTIRIRYASKQSSIANGWKKWQGALYGLERAEVMKVKAGRETAFIQWARQQEGSTAHTLLEAYEKAYKAYAPLSTYREYINEAALGMEIVSFAWRWSNLVELGKDKNIAPEQLDAEVERVRQLASNFFRNYHLSVDREVVPRMLEALYMGLPPGQHGTELQRIALKYKGDFDRYAHDLFRKSLLADRGRVDVLLNNFNPRAAKLVEKDPAYQLATGLIVPYLQHASSNLAVLGNTIDSLDRLYMQAQIDFHKGRTLYPDANSSLRITYGKVEGYEPWDAVAFESHTWVDGIKEKSRIDNPEYELIPDVSTWLERADQSAYAVDGRVPVCFVASNHTSGGNSGSPVMNGKGQLVGLNFDRNWQGTMSDILYDIEQCRNISVDVRYILFVVDTYAGADRLMEEMEIVR